MTIIRCDPPASETSDPQGGKGYHFVHHIKLFIYYNQIQIVILTAVSLVPCSNLIFVFISINLPDFQKPDLTSLHSWVVH